MALGPLLAYPQAGWSKARASAFSELTTVGVFLIIFLMMVDVRFGALVMAETPRGS